LVVRSAVHMSAGSFIAYRRRAQRAEAKIWASCG